MVLLLLGVSGAVCDDAVIFPVVLVVSGTAADDKIDGPSDVRHLGRSGCRRRRFVVVRYRRWAATDEAVDGYFDICRRQRRERRRRGFCHNVLSLPAQRLKTQ